MLSNWLHKMADRAERLEVKLSAPRGLAGAASKFIAIMAIGAFIAGAVLSSLLLSPVALGAALALPFLWLIVGIYRILNR